MASDGTRFRIIFRPYKYCGKTCGSLAASVSNQGTRGPAMCKVSLISTRSLESASCTAFSNAIKSLRTEITNSAERDAPIPGRPGRDRQM